MAVDVTTRPQVVTQRPDESPANACRRLGWGTGTRLIGDEGYGDTVIEITAVGERSLLAISLSHDGKPCEQRSETLWTLDCRDWRVVT